MAFAAVLAVVHSSHEDTRSALCMISIQSWPSIWQRCKSYRFRGTLPPQPLNLPIAIDLVVFQNRELGLLALVLDLLGSSVHLLLTLLGTTAKTKDEVKGRLLLDIVVGEGAAVFELLTGED